MKKRLVNDLRWAGMADEKQPGFDDPIGAWNIFLVIHDRLDGTKHDFSNFKMHTSWN